MDPEESDQRRNEKIDDDMDDETAVSDTEEEGEIKE